MADLQTIVREQMQRGGTPTYSFDDLHGVGTASAGTGGSWRVRSGSLSSRRSRRC
jgi:hypothetical protein